MTVYLHRALDNHHEAGVWTVMHRVTQTSTTVSCSKIVVRMTWLRLLTWGALLTRAAIDPRSRAEPHVDPGHAHAVWSGRQLSFFLCQHVLITNINCSRYSQPFEPVQNMQMTHSGISSRCPAAHSLQLHQSVLFLCLKFYGAFSVSCFTVSNCWTTAFLQRIWKAVVSQSRNLPGRTGVDQTTSGWPGCRQSFEPGMSGMHV